MLSLSQYVKNSGYKISILPAPSGVLYRLELVDIQTGIYRQTDILDEDVEMLSDLDLHIMAELDRMADKIEHKKRHLHMYVKVDGSKRKHEHEHGKKRGKKRGG